MTFVVLKESSESVVVGSYYLSQIDIDDVKQFDGKQGVTAGGALIHELIEQQTKQLNCLPDTKLGYDIAHSDGVGAENRSNGSTRNMLYQKDVGQTDNLDRFTGTTTLQYQQNGKNLYVSMTIVNNNVTSVQTKIENPKRK